MVVSSVNRPMRNRVTPTGDIVAIELRGAWTGNRGILHEGTDVIRFHRGPLWITCALRFRDYKMRQWTPGSYTVLFFHDEAVSFAAGHRPCAECRREAYNEFRSAWAAGTGEPRPKATELDRRLHGERIVRGTRRRRSHATDWASVPVGTFVSSPYGPALVLDDRIVPWTTDGYASPRDRPVRGRVDTITPPSTVGAFARGYRPGIDPAALTDR